jgi:hypothetical protein
VANSAVAVAEKDGGSYFDSKISEDGAATRFDAFTQWGVPIHPCEHANLIDTTSFAEKDW